MNNKTFSELMALALEKAPDTVGVLSRAFDKARFLDFLAPLLLRLYLAPVFWMAGSKKFTNFSETAEWFGNAEWGITTHWSIGWLAIAAGSGFFASDRTVGAMERLQQAKDILQSQGDYQWLTENGSLVILNNGIEFAATYFIMLLVLFFMGGGRFVSADYWLARRYFSD